MKRRLPRQVYPALVALGLATMVAGYGYWRSTLPPGGDSPLYESVVSAFYAGTIALQVGDTDHATEYLTKATQLAPREPAVWTNLGILQLRLSDYDAARKSLDTAQKLAPDNARIEAALADVELAQGRSDEAIVHLKRALELEPNNVRALYAMEQALSNAGDASSAPQIRQLLDTLLKVQPNNLAVLVESLRVAASSGEQASFTANLSSLKAQSQGWTSEQKEAFANVETAAKSGVRGAALPLARLSNLLRPSSAYQGSILVLGADPDTGTSRSAAPLEGFLWLKPSTPNSFPAAPDLKLTFTPQPFPGFVGRADAASAFLLGEKATPAVFAANSMQLRRVSAPIAAFSFPSKTTAPTANSFVALDWNFDFRQDVVVAGAGGLRLLLQKADGTFADETAQLQLPAAIIGGDYVGVWTGDIEADGDLDLIVAPRVGVPFVVRNNGDETVGTSGTVVRPFKIITNVRNFAWADFDDDGSVDAAFLDGAGAIRVALNERSGTFKKLPNFAGSSRFVAICAADINRDGLVDLLALGRDGTVSRFSMGDDGQWNSQLVTKVPTPKGGTRLLVADLDNNGVIDLVVSSGANTQIELADDKGGFATLAPLAFGTFGALDLNGDGRLDLVGIDASGVPQQFINSGAQKYAWENVRPLAQSTPSANYSGNKRINPFGVGGTLEVRSGLHYQKQIIDGPQVHFGLGNTKSVDSLRIIWPNGSPQGEFDLQADRSIEAKQRLTGSCPFLWAFDGKGISFIKDCNWRSPLGLRINGQDTAGVVQTQDWVKVEGGQIVPRDGQCDLRVTADLWEAHMFDYLALEAVDHPAGTEMWVDERFSVPMPPLGYTLTGEPHPVVRAVDNKGADVTATVANLDGNYLDTFGRGPYQGVARDHFVEVELPANMPASGPLWLLAQGWLHPTDSSINVALSQGRHTPPRDLSVEVANGRGGWKVVHPHMGFPSGKNKTILVDLKNALVPGAPRRVRLRTDLEIFWDRLMWAGAPSASAKATSQRVLLSVADLRFRGVSTLTPKNASSPELPGPYEQAKGGQQWRDLVGFYTRFGDVRPLLQKVDDRYVLMNAGDEMRLRFKAPSPVRQGWKRDFIFITDGWTKDGNLNTAYSKTLLPLPLHSQPLYAKAPVPLEQDPAYRLHPRDWQQFHTRWVGTTTFRTAMRPSSDDASVASLPQPSQKPDAARVRPQQTQLPAGR